MKHLLAFISLIVLTLTALPLNLQAAPETENEPKAIFQTPPPPRFTDAERQAELSRRRARVFDAMQDKSVLVLFSAEPKIYTNDVNFIYRQENNLYYLTALKQDGAMLVLSKNGADKREFLFLPKRSPQFETWNGRMYSNEDATRLSGLQTIIPSSEVKGFLDALKDKKPYSTSNGGNLTAAVENVYLLLPDGDRDSDGLREFRRENEFSKTLEGYKIVNAQPIFGELRAIKSQYEIKMMQHAIDISTEAHMRAMATSRQVKWEYETQAEIEYVFRRRNADYWGYPSIVGCGPNATTLHYEESQGEVKQGSLLLMDVGAEYEHYSADVTRTFPVNGKFSKEQADIYQIVYDAQEAAAAQIKPGVRMSVPSQAATTVIENGLVKLGLIEKVGAMIPGSERQIPDGKGGTRTIGIPQYALWYMHGWGHWLGMNVHDVGDYGAEFKPGMIMTNEPGIYLREDALDYFDLSKPEVKALIEKIRPAYEKYKGIGVRIEDDMLVTETGTVWMTKNLPRKMSDIEDFMARSSKEITVAGFPTNSTPNLAFFDTNLMQEVPGRPDLNALNGQTVRSKWIFAGSRPANSD